MTGSVPVVFGAYSVAVGVAGNTVRAGQNNRAAGQPVVLVVTSGVAWYAVVAVVGWASREARVVMAVSCPASSRWQVVRSVASPIPKPRTSRPRAGRSSHH